MDNNDQNQNQEQNQPQRGRLTLPKIAITALVAGLLGGGLAFGGLSLANGMGGNSVPVGSNSTGTAQTSKLNVSVNSQSTKAFNSIKGAVVSVINLQKQQSSNSTISGLLGGSDSSSSSKSKSDLQAASEGSGVIYKKSGNAAYIVTNNHVVAGSNSLEVIMSNGKKLNASLVGKDKVTDLAVLKINSSSVTQVASFGDSDKIQVGENALAIGSPLGSQYATSLTEGIISAKKRTVKTQDETTGQTTGNATVIQTDAAINPGNSGGPLINLAGQVIGINSMKLASDSQGTSVEGIGFAIPSNEVVTIINQLVKDGKVSRPALGVSYVDLSQISASQQKSILKLPSSVENGVVIMKVNSGSAASSAGLKKYDVITKLDGTKISDQSTLRDVLYKHKMGDKISVTYYHNGSEKTGNITLDKTN